MNVALEQTEEYVGGTLRNKYGDAFIRGNNGASTAARHVAPFRCAPVGRRARRSSSSTCSGAGRSAGPCRCCRRWPGPQLYRISRR